MLGSLGKVRVPIQLQTDPPRRCSRQTRPPLRVRPDDLPDSTLSSCPLVSEPSAIYARFPCLLSCEVSPR
ncbi:hypothetical protein FRUB_00775 [Fimbriiglobus ruber]|uniref:Uncharacterized protein n=1 Tax=Fimbriiglobus ruber TaxID=1908690 RepID=A0A225EAL7_9BACT|nr:hypothetical protein FRUB_00775 [Fimbriiglobus ruber]